MNVFLCVVNSMHFILFSVECPRNGRKIGKLLATCEHLSRSINSNFKINSFHFPTCVLCLVTRDFGLLKGSLMSISGSEALLRFCF